MNLDKVEEQLRFKLEENMKKAFFNNIGIDISNNSFDSSFSLLSEIKERICNLVPNRKDIHKDFDEHLDIDFYKQIQSNGALDINMIHGIINYIIDQIKNFGSLEDEPWNEIWKTQIVVKINRGEPLNILLPDFFKEAMHRIDKIEMEINAFKQSDLYKYFSEKRKTRE
tara:strand:+ start:264 stop:770 length:507 start_codon:yes stop_codon:yes gene_type:complete